MRPRYVRYDLEHGFVHNWLVAGPQAIPVETGQFKGENLKQQIAQAFYESASGITKTPVERGPLDKGLFQIGAYSGSWNYYACREDHLVEHSALYATPQFVRSWAYTQLESKTAREISLVLFAYGPVDLWLNDQHVLRQEQFSTQQPGKYACQVPLKEGLNRLLVRFEAVALRASSQAMALQVCMHEGDQPYQAGEGIRVSIPTLIQAISRRNQFERVAVRTYITQDVFEAQDQIRLHWPKDLEETSQAVVRLMKPTGSIYAEATVDGTAGDQLFLQFPNQIPPGPYRIFITPRHDEYYDQNLRITREINLWSLGRNRYSATPYGTFVERRREALLNATQWPDLFAEIAKMALNQWSELEISVIRQSMQRHHPQEILGLLGMLYRFGEQPQFPADLRQPLEDYLLGYPFGLGGTPEMEAGFSEAEQILSYAAEILAGQRYPERRFSSSGQTGQWHRQNGERLALEWIQQRAAAGFADWDSPASFAGCLVALSHLVDLAETDQVWDLAAVLMDKLFVSLALNSYRGVFGSTHGRASALDVKGGLLEPTAGIARLMWGTGIFNQHIAGTVSLACMERYELPSLVSDMATSNPDELWSRERHAVDAAREVNKVTYKTPDGMLCSAQDYYPGQPGSLEHIWQATLGANATVFVTHPACANENEARQPNFWAGNARLPRVAQWKDALIAVYQLPDDDWMGYTHAYFPIYAFDEYVIREEWAFARKGDGYLAIASKQPCHLVENGPAAFRELRSDGLNNIWLCQMGRAALDGDFATFQEKILAQKVEFTRDSVRWTTLRDERLSFGWQESLLRNGEAQPLAGFAHYDHPWAAADYPCQSMDVRFGEAVLRLNFDASPNTPPQWPDLS